MGVSDRWEKGTKEKGTKKKRKRDRSASSESSQSSASASRSPVPKKKSRRKQSHEREKEEEVVVKPKKRGRGFQSKRNFGDRSRSPARRRSEDRYETERPPSPDRRPQDYVGKKVYSRSNQSRKFYGLAQTGSGATSEHFRRGPGPGAGPGRRRSRSRSRSRGRDRDHGKPAKKLFVGRLSFDTSVATLERAFSEWPITDCFIPLAEGQSKGFGFVTFKSVEDASAALEKLDQTEVDGRQIAIEYAKERESDSRLPARRRERFGERDRLGDSRITQRRERFGSFGSSGSGALSAAALDDDLENYFKQ